jgi:hypothetical protein
MRMLLYFIAVAMLAGCAQKGTSRRERTDAGNTNYPSGDSPGSGSGIPVGAGSSSPSTGAGAPK